jgi:hypothetical protein
MPLYLSGFVWRCIPLTECLAQTLFISRRQRRNSKLSLPLKIHYLGMFEWFIVQAPMLTLDES